MKAISIKVIRTQSIQSIQSILEIYFQLSSTKLINYLASASGATLKKSVTGAWRSVILRLIYDDVEKTYNPNFENATLQSGKLDRHDYD